MANATISNFLYQLREEWANEGPPGDLWEESGELCAMMETRTGKTWTGTGDAKLANRVKLNGNIGPNFDKAFNTSTPPDGVQWVVHARDNWAILQIEGRAVEFATADSMISGEASVADLAEVHGTSFMRQKSYLLWGDGTGRIGKGNAAYNVAATVITFLNKRSAAQFEEDDVIVLIAAGAAVPASGMPVPRAGTLTVTAVDENLGTITVGANVNTIVGAVNTDYVSKDVFYDSADGLLDGIFRWLPITTTESLTTWAGIDRSTRPARLSGGRVQVTPTMTPYQIVAKMGVALKRQIGMMKKDAQYFIFVPSGEIESLMAEASVSGVTFSQSSTDDVAKYLVMGFEYIKASWPGLGTVGIVVDHWLHDPNVTQEEDRTYVLLDMGTWKILTGRTGQTWKQYEDNGGMLKYKSGENNYYAQYGFLGNTFCMNIRRQVVASTRADS